MDALPLQDRADRLLSNLRRIQDATSIERPSGEVYYLPALAVEGWLRTAVAAADQLAAELRGDVPDPGGEHGGPAD